jgi:hypothetical protein
LGNIIEACGIEMIERIQELYETAVIAAGRENHFTTTNMNVAEKFAELIVQECMELNCQELSFSDIDRLLPLYKEHFGIE